MNLLKGTSLDGKSGSSFSGSVTLSRLGILQPESVQNKQWEEDFCSNEWMSIWTFWVCLLYLWVLFFNNLLGCIKLGGKKEKVLCSTYAGNLTSISDLLREIISDATKLNWLILNFSFFSSSLSLGIWTALPNSPGIPSFLVTGSRCDQVFSKWRSYPSHFDFGGSKSSDTWNNNRFKLLHCPNDFSAEPNTWAGSWM